MAAFSSLALLGLGLAGGMAASKLTNKNKPIPEQQIAATQQQGTVTPPPAPAPAPQATSTATKAAQQASVKQRRKAAPVSTAAPVRDGILNPKPILQPATLLGV